jgi:hypothetical protein
MLVTTDLKIKKGGMVLLAIPPCENNVFGNPNFL